jgi:hypothetical protein
MKTIIKSFLSRIIILAAGFFAVGCVGGGGSVTADTAPKVISSFASVLAGLPRGNTKASLPSGVSGGGVTTSSISAKASLPCETVNPLTPVDADGDGIALLKTYTFNCSDYTTGGVSYNHTGTFTSIDKNDAVAGQVGGYRYEFDMPKWYYKSVADGFNLGGTHKGYWEGTGTTTSSTFAADYAGSVHGESNYVGMGPVTVDYTFKYKFDVSYTHNAAASGLAWAAGTMTGKGTYALSGTYLDENETPLGATTRSVKTGDAIMVWETDSLTFDATCSRWYKTGKITMTDTGGNKIVSEFACTTSKVYLNGTELPGVVW